jgi:hypothetical protein
MTVQSLPDNRRRYYAIEAAGMLLFGCGQRPRYVISAPTETNPPNPAPAKLTEKKLLDVVRDTIRLKHYSIRTEEAYVNWIRRFILFHDKRHPKEMGAKEVEAFLTHLAVEGHVAASTQNQALAALLFLYRDVLHHELADPINAMRAKESQHLPAVLTKDEVLRVIAQLTGIYQLQARLLYGAGLRLLECLRLRVKDVDFERRTIIVRDTKGDEDRVTMLPDSVVEPLKEHLQRVKRLHEADLAKGLGRVRFAYQMPSIANSPTPVANGSGNTSSHPISFPKIRVLGKFVAITWTKPACSAPCARPPVLSVSINASPATPSGTASPPTSSKTATTSAPSKSCSVTRTSKPP